MKSLTRHDAALLVIDAQERLFPHIEQAEHVLKAIVKAIRGCKTLDLPVIISEQVPEKMGPTLHEISSCVAGDFPSKSTFSCLGDSALNAKIVSTQRSQWVVCGIETHVCVLQTVRDLLVENNEVVVLRDAVGSRSSDDHVSALEEMRHFGARISTVETVLFELLQDAQSAEFKNIRDLVK